MTKTEIVVPSRDEVFADVVEAVVGEPEILSGLHNSPGIDAEYLRSRCEQERDQFWADLAPGGEEYDAVAENLRRLQRTPGPLRFLYWVLSSWRLQVTGAFVALLLTMSAWVIDYDPGPLTVSPNYSLLGGAVILAVVALLHTHWLDLVVGVVPRGLPEIRQVVFTSGKPLLWFASVLLFFAAVGMTMPAADAWEGSAWSSGMVMAAGLFSAFAAGPLLRAAFRTGLGSAEVRLAVVTFFCAFSVFITVLLVVMSGKDEVLVVGEPNTGLLFPGLWLLFGIAVVSFVGFLAKPAELLRAHHRVTSQILRGLLVDFAVRPFLREEINRHTQVHDVEIDVHEAPGLSQLSDPMYQVPTAAAEKVARLFDSMPGGSIGLAGARGSGKTTLIESYCAGDRRPDGVLATMVSAPVEYAAREFLLHLYAKVCREVVGSPGLDPVHTVRRRQRRTGLLVCAVLSILAGVTLLLAYDAGVRLSAQEAWAAFLLSVGVLVVAGVGIGAVSSTPVRGRGLVDVAAERLEEIRFQQSFSSTWSGAVKVPLGVEAMVGGGRGLTRQPLHLPEIVDSMREFLELAAREHRVIVGIDELDKMESEAAAEQFLNEIKSVFGVRGCYFLVSVSEDAMSSFERRGLPFRDVFDSTFDEIVWFEHLTPAEAIASIDRRVLLMPVPFKQLCFALSGGLPRDLIRVARLVIDAQTPGGPTPLAAITAALVEQDVRRKSRAIGVAVRRIDLEPDVSRLLLVCARVRDTTIDSGTLMAFVEELRPASGSRARVESTTPAGGAFLRLASELACFYYYAATVLDYFDEARPGDGADPAGLDHLAAARQAFSSSTRVAWEGISIFRRSCGLIVTDFPTELEPKVGV